jgi:NitT/TauT family transport system substrate-binding protein
MRIINKISWKWMYLLVLPLLLLNSCKDKNTNSIRIGVLQGPSAISFIQMINTPTVIDGKTVEIIIKNDPQQIQALMMRHELDFAVLPTVMAANLYNKGIDYRIIACPVWGTLYIVTNQPNISTLEDISGHSVSVFGQGATPDILLQREIQNKGIINVKLDYTFSGNNETAQALLQNKTQIAVISEPLVSTLISKNKNIHIVSKLNCEEFFRNSDIDIFAQSSFVVSNKFINNYNDIIPLVRDAYSTSCNFINEQPDEAAKMLVNNKLIADIATAKLALPLCNIRYVGAFAIEREINRYLQIYFDFDPKSIGGKMPARDFIYQ